MDIRLWSLHPKYLDRQTLTDLWRDCVRACRLIKDGKTKRYPQLARFLDNGHPYRFISEYMHIVVDAAERQGWQKRWLFDRAYIPQKRAFVYPLPYAIPVTAGQMEFETWHYAALIVKGRGGGQAYVDFLSEPEPEPHPIFTVCSGAVEPWEKLSGVGYTQCENCKGPIYHGGAGKPPKRCESCRPNRA